MRAVHLALAFALLPTAVVSQGLGPIPPVAPYQLRQIRSFGWFDIENSQGLTDRERQAGGAILGRVSDLTLSADGSELLVLDALGYKIVRFDTAGNYNGLILGGAGEGPGEFRRPTSIAALPDGEVAVLDARLRRISVFSQNGGSVLLSFQVATSFPLQIAAHGDQLLLLRLVLDRTPLVLQLDLSGATRDSAFVVEGRLADFVSYGEPGRLGLDRDGRAVLAYPTPGLWAPYSSDSPTIRGRDLSPDVRGTVENVRGRDVRGVRLGSRGFAQLADGTTIILAIHAKPQPGTPARTGFEPWLLFFSAQGQYQGYLALPVGHTGPLVAGPTGTDILIGSDDPYPQVVEYEVVKAQR